MLSSFLELPLQCLSPRGESVSSLKADLSILSVHSWIPSIHIDSSRQRRGVNQKLTTFLLSDKWCKRRMQNKQKQSLHTDSKALACVTWVRLTHFLLCREDYLQPVLLSLLHLCTGYLKGSLRLLFPPMDGDACGLFLASNPFFSVCLHACM